MVPFSIFPLASPRQVPPSELCGREHGQATPATLSAPRKKVCSCEPACARKTLTTLARETAGLRSTPSRPMYHSVTKSRTEEDIILPRPGPKPPHFVQSGMLAGPRKMLRPYLIPARNVQRCGALIMNKAVNDLAESSDDTAHRVPSPPPFIREQVENLYEGGAHARRAQIRVSRVFKQVRQRPNTLTYAFDSR